MSHRKHIALLLLLLPALTLGAQRIHGTVTDADGHPVELANVAAVSLSRPLGTVTDARGSYQLSLPAGRELRIRYSYTGLRPVDTLVTLQAGQQLRLDIQLQPSATQLTTVTIVDEKSRATTFEKIETDHLANLAGPTGGVEALLKTLPDVSSNNELSSQYSVRGGSFDENLVYINDVEVYRPQLVRNGQQEGMSLVNPDLVSSILFSPGGFDATYGDRLSSVLDLDYARPTAFSGSLSASFLGGSAALRGVVGSQRPVTYAIALRRHSNRYLFSSLDTKGQYTTAYTDLQSHVTYKHSDHLDLSLLAIYSRNRYGLVPEERTTTFGTFQESLEFDVYFEGQEMDYCITQLGALTLDWHPTDQFRLKWITSAQHIDENELYDILSQYWIYQLEMGESVGEYERFDRGYGSYLEHARNYLSTTILSSEVKAIREARLGDWKFGLKYQHEQVDDRVNEWKWVDSANYTLPLPVQQAGDSLTPPLNPILQNYCSAHNALVTHRLSGYAQRSLTLLTRHDDKLFLNLGLRGQLYRAQPDASLMTISQTTTPHAFLSPRLSLTLKPHAHEELLFRLAAGIYQQAPFYREYRSDDGQLHLNLRQQTSYQASATADCNFHFADIPLHLSADIYYKYITHLIPYRIDNLRIRYDATNDAVAYATGLSLRLGGTLVDDLESWASLSLMKTQEDLLGDDLGWLDRPSDQRISFKLYFQDNIPDMPFWRMSLNFIVGDGLPTLRPNGQRDDLSRLPAYYRVDWGNTLRFSQLQRLKGKPLFQKVDDLQLTFEVFNLFNYHNVVSYVWVADYSNTYYPVPEYLTARQVNLKITLLF